MTLTNFRAEDFEKKGSGKTRKRAAKKAAPKPAPAGDGVPEGTVEEILEWAGDDEGRRSEALEAEKAKERPRKTLVEELEPPEGGDEE